MDANKLVRAKTVTSKALHPIAKFRGAIELGWFDFETRFRRAFFGPLWITFQLAMWIASLALILHGAFREEFAQYIVYVGVGFFFWEFISSILVEGPGHFTSRSQLLKNVPMSLSYLTIRRVSYLFSRSLFQIPVPVVLVVAFGGVSSPAMLLLLFPLVILLACLSYAGLVLFGLVGAFYRDAGFLNASVVRFLFFTSPIIWRGDEGVRKVISDFNPISYFLEIGRAPFEGVYPSLTAWLVVGSLSLGGLVVSLWLQSVFRNRLIYWL